ncbi:PspC domain-containing protein [Streptomyces sp. NPDC021212]|uniref:PspC domain-containing protein n=1 Tax=Streptomyces sp. NPDC021212 TaxID=3365118 RepID=UPI0037AE8A2A
MTDAPTVADEGEGAAGSGESRGTQPPPFMSAPLRRSRDQKMISGVCGGLGRYCDVDPVIFRVVLSMLAVAGGIGLIVYGFCWLLVPLNGEDENEGRRLLSGRVEGPALTAVLCALVGCGLFLSMLNNGGVVSFSFMLFLAVAGVGYWSHHRRQAEYGGAVDSATAQAVADAPPEAKAPPTRGGPGPSWWRDPIVKDGTTGLPGGPGRSGAGYLWGPDDGPYDRAVARAERARRIRDRSSIGGWIFLVALAAAAIGIRLSWYSQPLGTSLEIGLTSALAVFGLGMVVSCWYGRTGAGTAIMTVVTCALLAAATALPRSVTTDWSRETWAPTSAGAVRPSYELGGGVGELKLDHFRLTEDQTVRTRAEVGAGKLAVTVPRDARLKLSIRTGLGDIRLPGEPGDNIDIEPGRERSVTLDPKGGPSEAHGTLVLRLSIGLGNVEVTRS